MPAMLLVLFLCLFINAHALEIGQREFCESAELNRMMALKGVAKIVGADPNPALSMTLAKVIEEFEIPGPLIFHFTDYTGPKKVWSLKLSDGLHIYFSKNAPDLLIDQGLQSIAAEVCRPGWKGRKTFTLTYTNSVLEQFLRHAASRETLLRVLTKRTGWKLRGEPGDQYYDDEQEFRTEELVTLAKQLMDIPAEVFQKMRLRKVTRWRHGGILPKPDAVAMYIAKDEKIILADGALMDSGASVYGEDTILHEMGHAYWYGKPETFREKFSRLSWIVIGGKWEPKTRTDDGFITAYSTSSPEEDFAEHFSAFMNQPELLKRKAPIKNHFLEEMVFTDATFFSTVAENAKVKIDSPTPDTTPPKLLLDLRQSLDLKTSCRKDGTRVCEAELEIRGITDDLSGIGETSVSFRHEENKTYNEYMRLRPEKLSDGTYILKGRISSSPQKIAAGMYRMSSLFIPDGAGNTSYFKADEIPPVYLEGFMSLNRAQVPDVDVSRIRIEKIPSVNGSPGVRVTLPIPLTEKLHSVYLTWEFPQLEGKTSHSCRWDGRYDRCLITKKFGDPVVMDLYFYKQYPDSQVKLASVQTKYKATETSAAMESTFNLPVHASNARTQIVTGNSLLELVDFDVNDMKLSVETGPNSRGGDHTIVVLIPLLNADAGRFNVSSHFRGPTGSGVSGIASEDYGDTEVKTMGGVTYAKFKVPLKKNPEDGVYILESFEVLTRYPYVSGINLDHSSLSIKKIKVLERGIRRTFTIANDKVTDIH